MENKRITQLSTERVNLTSGDYVMVDDADNGSAKYRLDRLKETDTTLSVSGKAADAAATGQAISDEAEARTQAVTAEEQARQAADTTLGNDVDDLKSALNAIIPLAKTKTLVFNKYGISRSSGNAGEGNNRLHTSLFSCNSGDIIVAPTGYKCCLFYYSTNGYEGNSYDDDGWWSTNNYIICPYTGLVSFEIAKNDNADFSEDECYALNNQVTLYSTKVVTISDIKFGVGHIDTEDKAYIWALHGDDYNYDTFSSQKDLLTTRWRTEERVKFVKGSTVEVTTGYRFYIFKYENNTVVNGQWLTGKYTFTDDATVRIIVDTTSSTKTPYTEWPDLDTVIKIVNNEIIITQQDEIDDLPASLRWKELYVGELVSAHLTASGLDYTDWLVPYRISSKNILALPAGDKRHIRIRISDVYVFAIRAGATAENLSENLYWYHNGDEIAIPSGCNYYAVSVAFNEPGQYGNYDRKAITPSETKNIGLKIYYSDIFSASNANTEAEKTLASARLFFSDSERNTEDKYAIIAHTSDCHGDYKRVENYYEYCDSMNVDVACVTGDIVAYRPSQGIGWFHEIIKNHQTLTAFCTGNHDVYNDDYTDADIYTYMFSDVATEIGNLTEKTWYYKDIAAKKLRIISINLYQYGGSNRWYTHFTEEQLNWFVSTLAATPTDYGVIVLTHAAQVSLDNARDAQHDTFFQNVRLYNNTHNHVDGAPIYDIVDAFISGTTLSKTYTQTGSPSSVTVSADFSSLNSGVEFIAHLTGHFHQDSICYVPNTVNKQLMLNVVCTTSVYGGSEYPYLADISDLGRNSLDSSQDAFNVYVVDRDNKLVKVIRVGQNKTYQMHERKYMEIPYADVT